eukprot:CAMPEP_0204885624 /NCGR_PEP_ID=MMETSP1349-20130617/13218_1 /ASSEMBLY_ACC=CAM_ASM_000710 /TAXON_ID=215587 /ORGANISM="Aplanochytrium stocchinoi, Strain GSBS06" /LENGTH=39 /DNA_ID= /DNA_START= /DNA_END= /DNA_ORIENTATION=
MTKGNLCPVGIAHDGRLRNKFVCDYHDTTLFLLNLVESI